ncbi:MAG: hypothetical protein KC419_15130 [Anaerolineales bacterium]|nr:hypothetical protein [Anaerolineales bacterium]
MNNFWKGVTAVIPLIALTTLINTLYHSQPASARQTDVGIVMRVYYDNISQIDSLARYDLWEYNNLDEQYVLVAGNQATFDRLIGAGWRVDIDPAATFQYTQASGPFSFFDGYRTVDELYAALETLNQTYPTLSELVTYGASLCRQQGGCTTPDDTVNPGFDLQAIRITNEQIAGSSTISGTNIISGTKPVFFLMANIHAREITTPELAMRMAEWLLKGYGTNPDATWLVDWHEIWIVPTTNPDGHWIVEQGGSSPPPHRKNGRLLNTCFWPSTSFSQYGVDLNRNHSFGWGGSSTSTFPCDLLYRGSAPLSEPETAALQDLVSALIPDRRGPELIDTAPTDTQGIFITIHSYSELVLWPWGHTASPAPNKDELMAIGDKFATFNGYQSCQPATCLYAASGTSDDWAYGDLGIPAFTFEVGTQFMPPYSEIDAVQWPDNGPAFQYAAKLARAPYQLIHGPDVTAVTTTISPANQLTITAVIDDSHNGNQSIASAVYTIDTPYWTTGAITETLTPADGSFDAPIETGTAVIDLNTLTPGRHLLYLRAQDDQGNWGVVTAVFANNLQEKVYLPVIGLKRP